MKKIIKAILKLLYIFPIKEKRIFFMSFNGTAIGFDSKAFAEWLNENGKKFEMIWGISSNKNKNNMYLPNTKLIKIKSIKGIYYLMTSKILFYNINPPTYIPYRKKQILINTWHGFPYKKVGKYTDSYSEERFNLATCFISHAQKYTETVLKDSFNFKGDILDCGAPRNDVFFNTSKMKEKEKIIRQKYNLLQEERIILYAPTFRKDFEQAHVEINFKELREKLQEKFHWKKCRVLCRFHPMISNIQKVNDPEILDVSDYPDMQDLLCAADILISDYSSAMWDFSLTQKLVIMYAPDIYEYQNDRGLYVELSELPFLLVTNKKNLIDSILKLNMKDYDEKLKKYMECMGNYEVGNSCERIYKYIMDKT